MINDFEMSSFAQLVAYKSGSAILFYLTFKNKLGIVSLPVGSRRDCYVRLFHTLNDLVCSVRDYVIYMNELYKCMQCT